MGRNIWTIANASEDIYEQSLGENILMDTYMQI